jgi:chloride channel 7
MESVLASLSEQELDSWINLRHYMQRVPFTIPATASVGRAYHLFRYSSVVRIWT